VLKAAHAPWSLFVTTDFADGRGRLWWLELEEAITRLDRVVLRGHGALRDLPSRTVVEKRASFEAIYSTCRRARGAIAGRDGGSRGASGR